MQLPLISIVLVNLHVGVFFFLFHCASHCHTRQEYRLLTTPGRHYHCANEWPMVWGLFSETNPVISRLVMTKTLLGNVKTRYVLILFHICSIVQDQFTCTLLADHFLIIKVSTSSVNMTYSNKTCMQMALLKVYEARSSLWQ